MKRTLGRMAASSALVAFTCSGCVTERGPTDDLEGQAGSGPAPWPDAGPTYPTKPTPDPVEPDSGVPAPGSDAGPPVEPPPPEPPPPPSVPATVAVNGAWGTPITIDGVGLGSAARDNVFLVVGDGALVLTPDDEDYVVEWTETRIVLRLPFPVEGDLSIETPQGLAEAGSFTPTWSFVITPMPAASKALASLSMHAGHVAVLADSGNVVALDDGAVTARDADVASLAPSSPRLYVTAEGALEVLGVSTAPAPEIVHLADVDGAFVAASTGIALESTEYALAGGNDGAVVWMRRTDGWTRAGAGATGWEIDAGPFADPNPSGDPRASGATSDGALYVGYAVDAGSLFDDMERPMLRRLSPAGTAFDDAMTGGHGTDDYLTSLGLEGRGSGLVAYYCGSDVDPWGLSSTGYVCYTSLHTTGGGVLTYAPNEGPDARYAFTPTTVGVTYCDDDDTVRFTTDYDNDPGEAILWPCLDLVATELDADRNLVLVARDASSWYFMQKKP